MGRGMDLLSSQIFHMLLIHNISFLSFNVPSMSVLVNQERKLNHV